MDYDSGYPPYDNLDSSRTIYNMYPKMNSLIDPVTKENNDNNTRMYSTRQSVSVDNMLNKPRRETLVRSIFRSASNLLSEGFTRGTSSILRNMYNMNNPLSVTIVSQDIYKSLSQEKNQLVSSAFENLGTSKSWTDNDESTTNDETLSQLLLNSDFSHSSNNTGDDDKIWEKYKNLYLDSSNKSNLNSAGRSQSSDPVNNSDCEKNLESSSTDVPNQKVLDSSTNFGNTFEMVENPEEIRNSNPINQHLIQKNQESSLPETSNKMIINDIGDHSVDYPKSDSSSLFIERTCTPKNRGKKKNRRDRSKMTKSKSGSKYKKSVSNHKNSKKSKRSKYDNSKDIKNEIDNWEKLEFYDSSEDEEESKDESQGVDVIDSQKSPSPVIVNEENDDDFNLKRTWWIAFDSSNKNKVFKRPERFRKRNEWTEVKIVQNVFADMVVDDMEELTIRPRLLSDSSVHSDNSFSIEFACESDDGAEELDDVEFVEDGEESDSDNDDDTFIVFASDRESESQQDTDDSEDDMPSVDCTDFSNLPMRSQSTHKGLVRKTKVRFNDKPTVHHMIHWNHAHRAARFNKMLYNLNTFRRDIDRVSRIITPVLDDKHRKRIYLERFAEIEN